MSSRGASLRHRWATINPPGHQPPGATLGPPNVREQPQVRPSPKRPQWRVSSQGRRRDHPRQDPSSRRRGSSGARAAANRSSGAATIPRRGHIDFARHIVGQPRDGGVGMSRASDLRRRLGGSVVLVGVATLAVAAVATASNAVKGGSYVGSYSDGAPNAISFKVSTNGKKVIDLTPETPIKCQGGCGGIGSGSGGSASISKQGKFKLKLSLVFPPDRTGARAPRRSPASSSSTVSRRARSARTSSWAKAATGASSGPPPADVISGEQT